MNTTSKSLNLKPLGIIIGALCIFFALYLSFALFLYLNDVLGHALIPVINVSWIYYIGYFGIIPNILILIWFFMMKGHLNNGARVPAIIGLIIGIILFIIENCIYFYCLAKGAWEIFYSNTLYTVFVDFWDLVNLTLIGIAFTIMSQQFDKSLRVWTMIVGIAYLLNMVALLYLDVYNLLLVRFFYDGYMLNIITIILRVTALLVNITLAIFFFKFSLKEEK